MSAIFQSNTLGDMLLEQTQAQIYAAALQIAQTLGLPVTSWQAGDPTRSLLYIEAQLIEALETIVVGYIQSGFLDYAALPNADGSTNPWLAIVAKQVFNVDVPAAVFAETTVVLTNAGGGTFVLEAGDLTFKNATSGATYTNTTGGTLAGVGATLSVSVVADLAGQDSSASAGEIRLLVTTLIGVSCTNPTAAVGVDAQAPATTVQQCRNKQGSLSPNGPASAYSYVALNQLLTGIQSVTRVRAFPDSEVGEVNMYVAGPGGAVSPSDVTAVKNAILKWATPLCITPFISNASNVELDVTYTLWLYASVGQTATQVAAVIDAALDTFFSERPIGGDILPSSTLGAIYQSAIEAAIVAAFPASTIRVVVSSPATDTVLANGDVAVKGAVTPTINLVPGP